MVVRLQHCLLADKDHKKSLRAYCHTFHKQDKKVGGIKIRIICCAKAFWSLPKAYQKGLVWHEIGHLLRPDIMDELKVDKVSGFYGVKVIRRSGKYGDNLEWSE